MKRLLISASVLSITAFACGGGGASTATPTPTTPSSPTTTVATTTFTVPLAASSEVPPVANGEAAVTGTATITLRTTSPAGSVTAAAITAATVDFQVVATGFPAGSAVTAAHIHLGGAGTEGGILVSTGLAPGDVSITGGSASFQKTGINVPADVAQGILNNPANYYFNVHSTLNPGGVTRGQLGTGSGAAPPPGGGPGY